MSDDIIVRNTRKEDFEQMIALCGDVYPFCGAWSLAQLSSHLNVFPDGQFVAIYRPEQRIVGMASSLVILWDDYEVDMSWRDFTDRGMFTNHDPNGRTLYGAEVMVHPAMQGKGVGKKIYAARRELTQRLGLKRIRAGARLRGYHNYADRISPMEYVKQVCSGKIGDPTLSFQLRQGFHVIKVVKSYLQSDPESLGHAALIEWLNPDVAQGEDYAAETAAEQRTMAESEPTTPKSLKDEIEGG
jgi:GNAT superfamily N-acetyltransferase